MADTNKTRAEQAAGQVAEWLARNEERFRAGSVAEGELSEAVGSSAEEVIEAVDYLENREEVVRFPTRVRRRRGWSLSPAGDGGS